MYKIVEVNEQQEEDSPRGAGKGKLIEAIYHKKDDFFSPSENSFLGLPTEGPKPIKQENKGEIVEKNEIDHIADLL